jgi:hypothetical protein
VKFSERTATIGLKEILLKLVSINFFCSMKTSKKNVVGVVKVLTQLSGENNKENKDLNVKILAYFLLPKTNLLQIQTDLYGLKNG